MAESKSGIERVREWESEREREREKEREKEGERVRERKRERESESKRKIDSGKIRIMGGESESSHDYYHLFFPNALMSIFFFHVY